MQESRGERRARERKAKAAEDRKGAPEKLQDGDVVRRTLVVMSQDLGVEFNRLLKGKNPLAGMIFRDLMQIHRVKDGSGVHLGGILVNVEELVGDGEVPQVHPSRIILPSGFTPPPPPRKS